ncbi:MAG: hypothetical protein ABIB72_03105 [Candidatus Falkowbacteria bacterium]
MPILQELITTTAIYDGRVLIPVKKLAWPKGKFWIVLLPQFNNQETNTNNNSHKKILTKPAKKNHGIKKDSIAYRESIFKEIYGLLKDKDNIKPLEYQHKMRDELEEHVKKLSK